jgi:hypothetical protein
MEPNAIPYQSLLFVNREKEIDKFNEVLEQVQSSKEKPILRHTILFTAEKGMGKTWLLRELEHRARDKENCLVFFIDLLEYDHWDPTLALLDIIEKFLFSLSGKKFSPASSIGATTQNMQSIANGYIKNNNSIVLLVDHVFEVNWVLLEKLDDFFLGPLATLPCTLVVMAGRGLPYKFKAPELRLLAENFSLDAFTEEQTQQQIDGLIKSEQVKAGSIYRQSRGNPQSTAILVLKGDETGPEEAVATLFISIQDGNERALIRKYLEALCVLRSFDQDRLSTMLTVYNQVEFSRLKPPDYPAIIRKILKYGLAHYDNEKNSYVIQDVVRGPIESYLQRCKPDLYQKLQRAALGIYEEWSQVSDEARVFWAEDLEHHQQKLDELHNG